MEITHEQLARVCSVLVCRMEHITTGLGLTNENLIAKKEGLKNDFIANFPDAAVIDKMWEEIIEI